MPRKPSKSADLPISPRAIVVGADKKLMDQLSKVPPMSDLEAENLRENFKFAGLAARRTPRGK